MYWFTIQCILARESLQRAMLNHQLKQEYLEGDVLDLGAGGSERYSNFIPRSADSTYNTFDNKEGEDFTDFEKDSLPYKDGQFSDVLLTNVLEHLYNPHNILSEIKRIKTERLIGYVPFLMWYHPDPHDFVRYTHESLERILKENGYADIEIVPFAPGPYSAAYQMVFPTIPRLLRPICFSVAYVLDALFRKLRGKSAERYVLGYYFRCR